jgi:Kef-type K+ transport system membrane component KefB
MARVVLVVTLFVVAGLAGWFALAKWDDANKVATVLSALGAVAAVGVAVWIALRAAPGPSVRVSQTGRATASSGEANSGFRSSGGREVNHVRVDGTGDAESAGGEANSGVRFD